MRVAREMYYFQTSPSKGKNGTNHAKKTLHLTLHVSEQIIHSQNPDATRNINPRCQVKDLWKPRARPPTVLWQWRSFVIIKEEGRASFCLINNLVVQHWRWNSHLNLLFCRFMRALNSPSWWWKPRYRIEEMHCSSLFCAPVGYSSKTDVGTLSTFHRSLLGNNTHMTSLENKLQ